MSIYSIYYINLLHIYYTMAWYKLKYLVRSVVSLDFFVTFTDHDDATDLIFTVKSIAS